MIDDTVEVKWDQPLEAVHEDGRVVPVKLDGEPNNPDQSGDYYIDSPPGDIPYIWRPDGTQWIKGTSRGWTIRNTTPKPAQEPVQGQKGREVAPEVVKRILRLCEAAVGSPYFVLADEARAIQALLEPVDEDFETAKRLAMRVASVTVSADSKLHSTFDHVGSISEMITRQTTEAERMVACAYLGLKERQAINAVRDQFERECG